MHRFVCQNGHISSSADPHMRPCGHCGDPAYRIVAAKELVEAGVNASDCVREVEAAGQTYKLHLRTGFAYTNADLRFMADVTRDEQDDDGPSIVACVVDSTTAYLVQWWDLAYGNPVVMSQ